MIFKFLNRNFFTSLLIVFLIFITDRLSKIYVINENSNIFNKYIVETKYLNIRLIWNEGIAFGLLSFKNDFLYNLLTIIIFIIILILFYMVACSRGCIKLGFLFILGGALGNAFDRIIYRAVPDFIDLHINNFHWFIFNISDIFITIGVIILISFELFSKKNVK